jgi:hypothetical protein
MNVFRARQMKAIKCPFQYVLDEILHSNSVQLFWVDKYANISNAL